MTGLQIVSLKTFFLLYVKTENIAVLMHTFGSDRTLTLTLGLSLFGEVISGPLVASSIDYLGKSKQAVCLPPR
jgi:hypothetical protein